MKKDGFTLVELLAVIVIISILLIIVIPSVYIVRQKAIKGLSDEEEKNIKEAGELLGIDLDDYMTDVYNCKAGSWVALKCTKSNDKWVEAKVSVEDLVDHGYFRDEKGHCTGELTVTKGEISYTVTLNNVNCE